MKHAKAYRLTTLFAVVILFFPSCSKSFLEDGETSLPVAAELPEQPTQETYFLYQE